MPYLWLPGYEVSVPGLDPWQHAPVVSWDAEDRQVELDAYWGGHPRSFYAIPAPWDS